MKQRSLSSLKIIEVPFDETSPMWEVRFAEENGKKNARIKSYLTRPKGRRELDDYKDCGIYSTAGVPYYVTEIECCDEIKPHEEQIRNISKLAQEGIKAGQCVVMTGGGCSHAIGMVGGLQQALDDDIKIGFIWLDAHGDFNTPESTESGLVGGTPLATIAGLCKGEDYKSWMEAAGIKHPIPNSDIILSDGRDMDPKEIINLQNTDVIYLNTDQFNNPEFWSQTVEKLAERVDVIYLHIDEDILDAKYTPGQYTETGGGPEVYTAMENISKVMETGKVCAFSLVSVFHENDNPSKELCTLNGMRLISAAFRNWKKCPEF